MTSEKIDISFTIPDEAIKQASAALNEAVRQIPAHIKNLSDEIADFNRRRSEMRERMTNGARRTAGRIV